MKDTANHNPLNEYKKGKFEFCGSVYVRKRVLLNELYPDYLNWTDCGIEEHPEVLPESYRNARFANSEGKLFVRDDFETGKYREEFADKVHEPRYERELGIMKGLLLEDFLPTQLVFGSDEFYDYDFGKAWLIQMIGDIGFKPALQELREVLLHADDQWLKYHAIGTISKLGGKEAAKVLCEFVKDTNQEMYLREDAAKAIYGLPLKEAVSVLRDAVEETRNTITDNYYESGNRMPSYALRALGQIPAREALDAIEYEIQKGEKSTPILGINLGTGDVQMADERLYARGKDIEHWARVSMGEWIGKSTKLAAKRLGTEWASERIKLLKKLCLKYDVNPAKDLNDMMRI